MKPVPIGNFLRGADTTAALQVSTRHTGTSKAKNKKQKVVNIRVHTRKRHSSYDIHRVRTTKRDKLRDIHSN